MFARSSGQPAAVRRQNDERVKCKQKRERRRDET